MKKMLEQQSTRNEDSFPGFTEQNAGIIAKIIGGEEWQSGGGIMLVLFRRQDGKLVVLSDEAVCEYASEEAFEENRADTVIRLR